MRAGVRFGSETQTSVLLPWLLFKETQDKNEDRWRRSSQAKEVEVTMGLELTRKEGCIRLGLESREGVMAEQVG